MKVESAIIVIFAIMLLVAAYGFFLALQLP